MCLKGEEIEVLECNFARKMGTASFNFKTQMFSIYGDYSYDDIKSFIEMIENEVLREKFRNVKKGFVNLITKHFT